MVRFGIPGTGPRSLLGLAALLGLLAVTAEARAELRICNQTLNLYNVAIGSFTGEHCNERDPSLHTACQFETQGWWNLPANGCVTPIKQPLDQTFYYVFALDIYGSDALTGERPFCVNVGKGFSIQTPFDDITSNTPGCWQRGYQQVKFKEIDVGGAEDWTVFVNQGSGDPGSDNQDGNDQGAGGN